MGQLLLHIYAVQKKKKLLQNISCNNTLGQGRVHFSYTPKFPQLHLQEHQQAEGKHKHDKNTMHSDTPYKRTHFTLIFSWATTATKTRHPMAWHTFTPLKESHQHPTVTQPQHHHLLLIKEPAGGKLVPNSIKIFSPCTQTEDKLFKKQNTSEPYSSMVVYFVPFRLFEPNVLTYRGVKSMCWPTDCSSDFFKKYDSMRKMSPTQTTCWHFWLQSSNFPPPTSRSPKLFYLSMCVFFSLSIFSRMTYFVTPSNMMQVWHCL